MEMRKLSGQDLYPVLNLLGKVGVKEMVIKYFKTQKEAAAKPGIDFADAGIDFLGEILESVLMNIERVRTDINKILASVCEKPVKEIESLDLAEYVGLIIKFFKKEELISFFKLLSEFLSN